MPLAGGRVLGTMSRADSGDGDTTAGGVLRLLEGRGDTVKVAMGHRCYLEVPLVRSFPVSKPDECIALRDPSGREIGVLTSLATLDAASRQATDRALSLCYFVRRMLRTYDPREISESGAVGALRWVGDTDRGATAREVSQPTEQIRVLPGGRVLFLSGVASDFTSTRSAVLIWQAGGAWRRMPACGRYK